jgi:hypothetical protein
MSWSISLDCLPSLYKILQVLSVTILEKTPLLQGFSYFDTDPPEPVPDIQLELSTYDGTALLRDIKSAQFPKPLRKMEVALFWSQTDIKWKFRILESGRATPRIRLLRRVPKFCLVRWICGGRILHLALLAPADVFRCSLANETLACPCMFPIAVIFSHSLKDRFPLPPAQGVLS